MYWKSEAAVTTNKRRHSSYGTVEDNYRETVARPLCDSRACCCDWR